MVVHLCYNDKILCGTNALNILKSTVKDDVTCKRCLSKLVRLAKSAGYIEPVISEPIKKPEPVKRVEYIETRDVVFIIDRRYGPCLLFDDKTITKLGDRISDRVGLVTTINSKGKIISGPLLKNVENITLSSGVETFRTWFRKQKETKEAVLISDIKACFT